MKVIINLEKEIEIKSIPEAKKIHNEYRDQNNFGSSEMYDSIILVDNKEIY